MIAHLCTEASGKYFESVLGTLDDVIYELQKNNFEIEVSTDRRNAESYNELNASQDQPDVSNVGVIPGFRDDTEENGDKTHTDTSRHLAFEEIAEEGIFYSEVNADEVNTEKAQHLEFEEMADEAIFFSEVTVNEINTETAQNLEYEEIVYQASEPNPAENEVFGHIENNAAETSNQTNVAQNTEPVDISMFYQNILRLLNCLYLGQIKLPPVLKKRKAQRQ
ncbi:hypothetical protein NQ317_011993 [Molorchus minor]|uniref:Uncharacterized protein n=1 Tax=Molorchus minor TaxID=1323400 RepID=A0ABQ9JB98_9CUCU|nr:hypothetical protein NQ317_011993 [Molorchus minor]